MNNNIKETTSLVFVKGKNLFDKNKIVAGYILSQNGNIAPPNNSEASSDYIAIESSNPYTFSVSNYTVPTGGSMWLAISLFDSNKNIIARYADYNISSITVTASQTVNAKYIRVSYRYNDSNIKCQLEYGSTVTAYEPYVEKQIHIKNKNGVFEEFYGESELNQENYSLGEQKIGSWINGKPLYRKVLDFGALPNNGSKDMSYDDTYNIVYINGYAWQNSFGTPIPNSHHNDNNAINLFVQNQSHQITIETYMDRSNYTNCFIWIYYTKTTD